MSGTGDLVKPEGWACPAYRDGVCRHQVLVHQKGRGEVLTACEVFRCSACGEVVPRCFGADDDHPTRCDACAVGE